MIRSVHTPIPIAIALAIVLAAPCRLWAIGTADGVPVAGQRLGKRRRPKPDAHRRPPISTATALPTLQRYEGLQDRTADLLPSDSLRAEEWRLQIGSTFPSAERRPTIDGCRRLQWRRKSRSAGRRCRRKNNRTAWRRKGQSEIGRRGRPCRFRRIHCSGRLQSRWYSRHRRFRFQRQRVDNSFRIRRGSFAAGWSLPLPMRGTTYYLSVSDFNLDGISDLAVTSDEEGTLRGHAWQWERHVYLCTSTEPYQRSVLVLPNLRSSALARCKMWLRPICPA